MVHGGKGEDLEAGRRKGETLMGRGQLLGQANPLPRPDNSPVTPPNCEWWLLLKKQIFHEASMLMSRVQVPLSLTAEWTRRDSGTCAGWPG